VNLQDRACFWPTPSIPGGGRTLSDAEVMAKGKTAKGKRQVGLENVARLWPPMTGGDVPTEPTDEFPVADCPRSRPPQMISNPGQTCLSRIYSLLPRSVKRRLNPRFVDELMRLPPGWMNCEPVATESFRLWRHTHTARLIELIESTSPVEDQAA
jgi:hypothetical protein